MFDRSKFSDATYHSIRSQLRHDVQTVTVISSIKARSALNRAGHLASHTKVKATITPTHKVNDMRMVQRRVDVDLSLNLQERVCKWNDTVHTTGSGERRKKMHYTKKQCVVSASCDSSNCECLTAMRT